MARLSFPYGIPTVTGGTNGCGGSSETGALLTQVQLRGLLLSPAPPNFPPHCEPEPRDMTEGAGPDDLTEPHEDFLGVLALSLPSLGKSWMKLAQWLLRGQAKQVLCF